MLHDVMMHLKNQLNAFLEMQLNNNTKKRAPKQFVVFPDGSETNPICFRMDAVSQLLINFEEETQLRSANRYQRHSMQQPPEAIQPPIRLNIHILFVANFKQYEQGLKSLSHILQYFQQYPFLTRENTPDLNAGIEQLVIELVTLSFAEQNSIWESLRSSYRPSVLYRVKMLVYQTEQASTQSIVKNVQTTLTQQP